MKLTFTPPNDGRTHTYCLNCSAETVDAIKIGKKHHFRCRSCSDVNPRALIIDPAINWWKDSQQEYWHEVAGVFIANPKGEFLFFDRLKSPFGLTVPAGHLDKGENRKKAAERELFEETRIRISNANYLATNDVRGDQCRRGSDVHRWHSFTAIAPLSTTVSVGDEGVRPVWLSLDQALARELTFATRHIITRHAQALRRVVR